MMKIIKKNPLLCSEENKYTSGVFINNSYKLLSPSNKNIDIFTCKLSKVCSKKVCYSYNTITEFRSENEFLVTKENDFSSLYIIDDKYNELSIINLKVLPKYKRNIKSISFCKDNCKIYICLENMLYSVSIDGDFIKEELSKNSINQIKYMENIIGTRCCQKAITKINLTSVSCVCNNLFITYIKNNSLYLSNLSSSGNIINTTFIDEDISVNKIFNVKGKLEFLVTKQNRYNYIYITDYCCKSNIRCNDCYILPNKDCCVKPCNKEKKCIKKNCEEDLCNIIESIALIETAIAHILNAEGEKIQKAVKVSCNCCELIKVNDSVAKMVTNVTMLEQILTEKLSLVIKSDCIKNKS